MPSVLIIEDKESMLEMLRNLFQSEGFSVYMTRDGVKGIDLLKTEKIDVIITDLKLPRMDGMELLKEAKLIEPDMPVIVMTAYGSIETAVSAMKMGAYDFITKPFNTDHLVMLTRRAIEQKRIKTENLLLKEEHERIKGLPVIIGKSPAINEIIKKIQKVARTKTTVLLMGESGTGKELFARTIHQLSDRSSYPFVAVNCAAIPRELLESELFGYEKGAFTGAEHRKPGRFELASGGTIFLDEIGELELSLQAKLLRAIESGVIERVGGVKPVGVDVRIIAATNKNLSEEVSLGRFREDLYYRLNVFPLVIPPLRERREDIPLLVDYFIKKFVKELNVSEKFLSDDAMELLMSYSWKGNVRELENTIERAMILCEGQLIKKEDISVFVSKLSTSFFDLIPMDGTLEEATRSAVRLAETERIKRALIETKGNKLKAADILGVSYKTLLTKIKEYCIES